MKKLMIGISLIALLLGSSFVFAQMSGGRMEGQKGDTQRDQMMERGGMMERGQMTSDMIGMSNQISETMGRMSGLMKHMRPGNINMMSDVMKDMSHQMMEMSEVIGSGRVSVKDMKQMHQRMMEIQKRMSEMEMRR
jgi:hypothetical protein